MISRTGVKRVIGTTQQLDAMRTNGEIFPVELPQIVVNSHTLLGRQILGAVFENGFILIQEIQGFESEIAHAQRHRTANGKEKGRGLSPCLPADLVIFYFPAIFPA